MTEREWMEHSTLLLRQRVEKFHPQAEAVDNPQALLRRFQRELEWQEYVLKVVRAGAVARLNATGRVWFDYMQAKARLQVARYEKRISEDVFQVKARNLRVMRDYDLKMLSKGRVA